MTIVLRTLDAPARVATHLPLINDPVEASSCCGGAAPSGADACCALDADVKANGGSGCGCNAVAEAAAAAGTPINTLSPTVMAGSKQSECC